MKKSLINFVLLTISLFLSGIFLPQKASTETFYKTIYHAVQTISVYETSDNKVYDAEVVIKAELYEETPAVIISIETKGFDKQNWTSAEEKLPLAKKYDALKNSTTKVLFVHDPEVSILETKQVAYIVPEHKRVELKPSEEGNPPAPKKAQGEKAIYKVAEPVGTPSDLIEILERNGGPLEKYAKEKLENEVSLINSSYKVEEVKNYSSPYLQNQLMTAKIYAFAFDTSQTSKKNIPTYIWMRIGIGDATRNGITQPIKIDFSFQGRKEN